LLQLVNYGVRNWDQGWRLSLGLAAVPAMILTLGERGSCVGVRACNQSRCSCKAIILLRCNSTLTAYLLCMPPASDQQGCNPFIPRRGGIILPDPPNSLIQLSYVLN
jgi:hypothetical protein